MWQKGKALDSDGENSHQAEVTHLMGGSEGVGGGHEGGAYWWQRRAPRQTSLLPALYSQELPTA